MFYGCNSLISLPYISEWKTSNLFSNSNMFDNCYSLISLPDLSNWKEAKVNDRIGNLFGFYY